MYELIDNTVNTIVSLFQVPRCSCRAIHFHASASCGQFICQWAREWQLAYQFELSSFNTSLKQSENEVEQWFEKRTGMMYILNHQYHSDAFNWKFNILITFQNISLISTVGYKRYSTVYLFTKVLWLYFHDLEPPNEEEGFRKIDKVDVRLICDTPYKVSEVCS